MHTSHAAGWGPDLPSPAQLKEFFAQIEAGRVNRKRMQAIIRGAGRWDQTTPPPIELTLQDWELFYEEYFGIRVDFTGIRIPTHQEPLNRLILMPSGLTLNQIRDAHPEGYECKSYCGNDLDALITVHERDPSQGRLHHLG